MSPFVIVIASVLASFVAGVVFSQKIKDWVGGVPSSLRSDLNLLQTHVVAQVAAAQKAVVADIHAAVVPATPVLTASKPTLVVQASPTVSGPTPPVV